MAKTKNTPKDKCFIIMPITVPPHMLKAYPDGKEHFTNVLDHLFLPAVDKAGFDFDGPIVDGTKVISKEIVDRLKSADMVLCDMSCFNPNVFFELGIRTALDRPICLVRDEFIKDLPFHTRGVGCPMYSSSPNWDPAPEIDKLSKHLTVTKDAKEYSERKNVWWQLMGVDYTAAITAGGDTADLNRLKLDQILSTLDMMRTPAGATAQLARAYDYRVSVEQSLGCMLPSSIVTIAWEWLGVNELRLFTEPALATFESKFLCDEAARHHNVHLMVSVLKVSPSPATIVNHPTRISKIGKADLTGGIKPTVADPADE